MPVDRDLEGAFSLVTFFGQAKKVTRPPGRRAKPNRDERSIGAKSQKRSHWVPALAGMPEKQNGFRPSPERRSWQAFAGTRRTKLHGTHATKKKAPIGRFIKIQEREILSLRWAGHRESNSYFLSHIAVAIDTSNDCSYRYNGVACCGFACPEPMTLVRIAVALSLASTG
jgi:hypothetical protein